MTREGLRVSRTSWSRTSSSSSPWGRAGVGDGRLVQPFGGLSYCLADDDERGADHQEQHEDAEDDEQQDAAAGAGGERLSCRCVVEWDETLETSSVSSAYAVIGSGTVFNDVVHA